MKNQSKEPNVFRPVSFYHAAPDNSGVAVTFSYNSSEDKLYVNLLKQVNYDNVTKRGLFNSEDKRVVKFSQVEAAEIALILQSKGDFHVVHNFGVTTNVVALTANVNDFSLKVTQTTPGGVEEFDTVLSRGEVNLVRLYIEAALAESFYRQD